MVTLAYHDYNLEWILLPDWCPTGVGWIWVQMTIVNGIQHPQIINVGWTKLSDSAVRSWSAIKGGIVCHLSWNKRLTTSIKV